MSPEDSRRELDTQGTPPMWSLETQNQTWPGGTPSRHVTVIGFPSQPDCSRLSSSSLIHWPCNNNKEREVLDDKERVKCEVDVFSSIMWLDYLNVPYIYIHTHTHTHTSRWPVQLRGHCSWGMVWHCSWAWYDTIHGHDNASTVHHEQWSRSLTWYTTI
jgi:hypothetical protein